MKEFPFRTKVGSAIGAASIFVSGLAAGHYIELGDTPTQNAVDTIYRQASDIPPIECLPVNVGNRSSENETNPDELDPVANYLAANSFYESINSSVVGSDGQILLNGVPTIIQEIKVKARSHVENGLCLVEGIPQLSGKFTQNGNTVTYMESRFDMNLPVDFNIVAVILKKELENLTYEDSSGERQKDIEDILSLRELPFTISVEEDAFPLIDSTQLIHLSRMQQLMRSLGLPLIKEVHFKGYRNGDPGGAWYNREGGLNQLTITNHSGSEGTITHEFGHHFEAVNSSRNTDFSLEAFASEYQRIRAKLGLRNDFDTPHETQDGLTINPIEEYAEAFKRAIGIDRGGINGSTTILDFEQDFFVNALGGRLFYNGLEAKRVSFDKIALGETYRIIYSQSNKMTLAASSDSGEESSLEVGFSPEVELKVLGGPRQVKVPDGRTVNMWLVGEVNSINDEVGSPLWVEGSDFVKLN